MFQALTTLKYYVYGQMIFFNLKVAWISQLAVSAELK